MTDENMAFLERLQKQGGGDFLKELAEAVLDRLMQLDVEGLIGAGRYERSDGRTTHRNGYCERDLETRLGTLELEIPKLPSGQLFSGLLGTAQYGRTGAPL
jgi:putative transposase